MSVEQPDMPELKIESGSGAETNVEPLKLGQRLREIRKNMQLTLEEASQKTGLARSTLSKIENEQNITHIYRRTKACTWLKYRYSPVVCCTQKCHGFWPPRFD